MISPGDLCGCILNNARAIVYDSFGGRLKLLGACVGSINFRDVSIAVSTGQEYVYLVSPLVVGWSRGEYVTVLERL